MDKYDAFLIAYIKETQANGCTTPEMDARAAVIERFNIGKDWAYEKIRKAVNYYPELHLEKVQIEGGEGKMHQELELTWRE